MPTISNLPVNGANICASHGFRFGPRRSAADRIPREEWAPLLDLALERADRPPGQGPAEGAVEAWPLEDAPGLTSRATLVWGAERGAWPGVHRVDPLLGNGAREALQAHLARRALPTAFHQQSEAELRGFWALASAADVLAVGWTHGPDREGPAVLAAQVLDEAAAPELSLAVESRPRGRPRGGRGAAGGGPARRGGAPGAGPRGARLAARPGRTRRRRRRKGTAGEGAA